MKWIHPRRLRRFGPPKQCDCANDTRYRAVTRYKRGSDLEPLAADYKANRHNIRRDIIVYSCRR